MRANPIVYALLAAALGLQGAILAIQLGFYRPPNAAPRAEQVAPTRTLPTAVVVDIQGAPTRGKGETSVVLVEFSDYECPFCARHANGVAKDLEKEFVETGKVRHAFLNNPLEIHPHAVSLAVAALCAGQQGRYWQMHDSLFERRVSDDADLPAIGKELNLDPASFEKCLREDDEFKQKIQHDKRIAASLEVNGTPSFAIGIADGSGRVHVERVISGAQPVDLFRRTLNEVIAHADRN